MKKLSTLLVLGMSLVSLSASAAVTVTYRNADSKNHELNATCSGSHYTVKFDSNTTGSATIQGSAPCVVKSQGPDVSLKGGEKVEIKDGKLSVK